MPHAPDSLFHAVECQAFGPDVCFLCGRSPPSVEVTDEHVVPKWLLEDYDLWNEHLVLLNGTSLPYRQLTIPCCWQCNTVHLQTIESQVSTAVRAGPAATRALPAHALFIWLGKILYGMLYKEGFLRSDRSNPDAQTIVSEETLEHVEMHHYFLQSVRVPMEFLGFTPASIQVYSLQAPEERVFQFDFRDHPPTLSIAMRIGTVGILGALQDTGAQVEGYGHELRKFESIALHPIQWYEMLAKFFYTNMLFDRNPKFVLAEDKRRIVVMRLPLAGLSTIPVFDDWNWKDYSQILAHHTGLKQEDLYDPKGGVTSWVYNHEGNVREMSLDEFPWP